MEFEIGDITKTRVDVENLFFLAQNKVFLPEETRAVLNKIRAKFGFNEYTNEEFVAFFEKNKQGVESPAQMSSNSSAPETAEPPIPVAPSPPTQPVEEPKTEPQLDEQPKSEEPK